MKLRNLLLAVCVASLACFAFAQKGKVEEDIAEGEDVDVKIEDDAATDIPKKDAVSGDKDLEEEEELKQIAPSPDAETYILFTQPVGTKDFAAGSLVKILVGFLNKGEKEFVVESLEASFRYPMDYSFYIQNYTAAVFSRAVPPNTEATFDYAFIPSEGYAGRPFGLAVNLNYRDTNDTWYQNAVFNETVTIIEDESGFNPETGFLYVVFGCILILLLLLGQQFLSKMRRKHGMTKRAPVVEMGTSNTSDIDYDWLPKELLKENNKSPKAGTQKAGSPKAGSPKAGSPKAGSPKAGSPKAGSPRQRTTRRTVGTADD